MWSRFLRVMPYYNLSRQANIFMIRYLSVYENRQQTKWMWELSEDLLLGPKVVGPVLEELFNKGVLVRNRAASSLDNNPLGKRKLILSLSAGCLDKLGSDATEKIYHAHYLASIGLHEAGKLGAATRKRESYLLVWAFLAAHSDEFGQVAGWSIMEIALATGLKKATVTAAIKMLKIDKKIIRHFTGFKLPRLGKQKSVYQLSVVEDLGSGWVELPDAFSVHENMFYVRFHDFFSGIDPVNKVILGIAEKSGINFDDMTLIFWPDKSAEEPGKSYVYWRHNKMIQDRLLHHSLHCAARILSYHLADVPSFSDNCSLDTPEKRAAVFASTEIFRDDLNEFSIAAEAERPLERALHVYIFALAMNIAVLTKAKVLHPGKHHLFPGQRLHLRYEVRGTHVAIRTYRYKSPKNQSGCC